MRFLTTLRHHINRVPLPSWLSCWMGDHDWTMHLDEYQVWWQRCRHCPVMREDDRLVMRGYVPHRRVR